MKKHGLTPEEAKEFTQLKRDLLEYHELRCTHYNPKKVRYNELWQKLVSGLIPKLEHIDKILKERRLAELN